MRIAGADYNDIRFVLRAAGEQAPCQRLKDRGENRGGEEGGAGKESCNEGYRLPEEPGPGLEQSRQRAAGFLLGLRGKRTEPRRTTLRRCGDLPREWGSSRRRDRPRSADSARALCVHDLRRREEHRGDEATLSKELRGEEGERGTSWVWSDHTGSLCAAQSLRSRCRRSCGKPVEIRTQALELRCRWREAFLKSAERDIRSNGV